MFIAQQHPHLSAAVKHIRGWVTILAVIVTVCCVCQMLTYGFVRFTDVRFSEVAAATSGDRPLQVVAPTEPAADEDQSKVEMLVGGPAEVTGGVRAKAIEQGREVGPVRTASAADSAMARINVFSTGAGTLACVILAALTLLGTVIAGGGNIPGVERTVTASTWALLLGLICLPWASAFPHLRIPGVFAAYRELCAVADRAPGAVSGTAAFFQWIVMPVASAVVALVVVGMYRSGVERGVIATSLNQFDTALQREMTDLAKRGVASTGPRALGALNRAVGAPAAAASGMPGMPPAGATTIPPAAAPMQVIAPSAPATVESALEEAAAMATSLVRDTQAAAGGGRSVADPAFRRLI